MGTGELAADALIQQGRRAAAPLCLARPPGAALRPPSARPHVPGHHCSLPPPPCECQCYLRPGPYHSTLNGNLRASPAAQVVKNLPALWETWFQSLGQEDTLEKGPLGHTVGSKRYPSRLKRTAEFFASPRDEA